MCEVSPVYKAIICIAMNIAMKQHIIHTQTNECRQYWPDKILKCDHHISPGCMVHAGSYQPHYKIELTHERQVVWKEAANSKLDRNLWQDQSMTRYACTWPPRKCAWEILEDDPFIFYIWNYIFDHLLMSDLLFFSFIKLYYYSKDIFTK